MRSLPIYDESLKAYLAPTGLVSEPRGDLTCIWGGNSRGVYRFVTLVRLVSHGRAPSEGGKEAGSKAKGQRGTLIVL